MTTEMSLRKEILSNADNVNAIMELLPQFVKIYPDRPVVKPLSMLPSLPRGGAYRASRQPSGWWSRLCQLVVMWFSKPEPPFDPWDESKIVSKWNSLVSPFTGRDMRLMGAPLPVENPPIFHEVFLAKDLVSDWRNHQRYGGSDPFPQCRIDQLLSVMRQADAEQSGPWWKRAISSFVSALEKLWMGG